VIGFTATIVVNASWSRPKRWTGFEVRRPSRTILKMTLLTRRSSSWTVSLETADDRVSWLLPRGPNPPGAGARHTGEHEPYCHEKPDVFLSQAGRPAPSFRGRGIGAIPHRRDHPSRSFRLMPVQPSKVCPGSLSFAKAISPCDATPSGQQSRTSKNHSASGSREVLMNDREYRSPHRVCVDVRQSRGDQCKSNMSPRHQETRGEVHKLLILNRDKANAIAV
jgi:hypothetical protein